MARTEQTGALIKTADPSSVRDVNRQAVIKCLRQVAPTTRARLARATGLSAPTVSAVVAEFERAGVVKDGGAGPATGGRRGALIDLIATAREVLTVDVSLQPAQYAFIDLRGDIIAGSGGLVPPSAMQSPAALVNWIGRRALTRSNLIGIGVAAPGVTDPTSGVVEWAPSLGWREVALGAMIGAAVGDLVIVIENDLNLAALGEYAFAGSDLGDLAMLGVRGGLGAGLIVGGALHRGAHYSAGEIGYLPYPGEPSVRDFGALEAALFSRAKDVNGDGKAAQGRSTGELITFACISLAAVLDINTIILDEEITAQFAESPELVADQLRGALAHPPQVLSSTLGRKASLRGAGYAVQLVLTSEVRRILT